jgi:hypothetical protein
VIPFTAASRSRHITSPPCSTFSGTEYVEYVKWNGLVSLVARHGSASCMQPSTTFLSFLRPLAQNAHSHTGPASHAHTKADFCRRIIARQRALRLTCIFCIWFNYCSPREDCNMSPDRPTRKRNASKATRLSVQGIFLFQ